GMARRQRDDWQVTAGEECIGCDHERISLVVNERGEGGLYLAAVARVRDLDLDLEGGSRRCASLVKASAVASFGFTSAPKRAAVGRRSRRRPSRFATSSLMKMFTPVALPPGRFRLGARASFTGSWLTLMGLGVPLVGGGAG